MSLTLNANDHLTTIIISSFSKSLEAPKDKISPSSNFFGLGGDSLQATKLISIINHKLSEHKDLETLKLSLIDFFDHPCPEQLYHLLKPQLKTL